MCDVLKCNRCDAHFCDVCLFHLGGGAELERAYYEDEWRCWLCEPRRPCVEKAVVRKVLERAEWVTSFVGSRHVRLIEDLRRSVVDRCNRADATNDTLQNFGEPSRGVRVISLCSGIGNDLVALRQMGIAIDEVHVFEIDPDALICFRAQHRRVERTYFYGDINGFDLDAIDRKLQANGRRLQTIDLIIGGFPCEGKTGFLFGVNTLDSFVVVVVVVAP